MEKYSRWADLTTGINPFVPHAQRLGGSLPAKGLRLLFGSALALLRLPLVALVGLAAALLSAVALALAPVPLLGRLLRRLVDWPLCALLLLLLGVFVTEEEANTRRLGLSTAKGKTSGARDARVRRGDVIVCNHTSFLEVLVLAKRFSPAFVFVSEESAAKGLVRVCGLPGAVLRAFSAPLGALDSSASKLEDVVKRARGPVVVFAEGARSNGKSVLSFVPVLQRLPASTRVHLVAFRYEFKNFSPSHSAGGGWRHYFWTTCRPYHSLRMTVLSAADLDLADGGKLSKAASSDSTTLSAVQIDRLRGLLAAMLRTKPVDLGVRDFVSFNAYWAHVTSGGRRPAAEFTDRKAPHEHAQWTKR